MLKENFYQLLSEYTNNINLVDNLWSKVEKNYNNKKRYYHNLTHLNNLLSQALEIKKEINDYNIFLFTLFYHDIVYNILKNDNEEKSALLAEKVLLELNISKDKISKCKFQIIATKQHSKTNDNDTDLFLDLDLSILGQDWDIYHNYTKQIRKEYSIYPDILYFNGRKKVLEHFLTMENIFKSNLFYNKFEKQARINIKKELETL